MMRTNPRATLSWIKISKANMIGIFYHIYKKHMVDKHSNEVQNVKL